MKNPTSVIVTTLAAAILLAPTAAHEPGEPHAGRAAVTVIDVNPASAAEAAGLEAGDAIVRLDGRAIGDMDDLRAVMQAHEPGDAVPLVVERDGAPVELTLTFAQAANGNGVSIGVRLSVIASPGAEPTRGTSECLAWIDATYRVDALARELDLALSRDYDEILACVQHDTQRMSSENAVKYCDNVFKVHCSAIDLLTEIGEAQIARCERLLGETLGADPDGNEAWRTCGRQRVFERYSMNGETSDADACRAALAECTAGARPDERSEPSTAPHDPRGSSDGPAASWLQWGGPNGDFSAPAGALAASWPEGGPPRLWNRPLGDGYSAILFEDGRLYTAYRSGENEVVVCLDAATGETIWERPYRDLPHARHQSGYGDGPNSTPLVSGDLLFTVGVGGRLLALDKRDGKMIWSRELWGAELGGNVLSHGYSSSPVAYADTVIVPVGGEQAALVAFDRTDGTVKWKTTGFENSFSSPRVVDLLGERQLVVFMREELIGVDPENGELRWSYPHANQWGHNIAMPVIVGSDTVFLSSPQIGARGLRLTREEGAIRVHELWSERRIQFYHGTSAREGDWVYGSSGMTTPAFLAAINVRTGEIGWRERGMAKANCVSADGKLLILDEDGVLYLASATPDALVVHSKTQLLDGVAWTVPTVVGRTLYARNNERILAVRLG